VFLLASTITQLGQQNIIAEVSKSDIQSNVET